MRVAFVVPCLRQEAGWRTLSLGVIQALEEHEGVDPLLIVSEADRDAAEEMLPGKDSLELSDTQFMAYDRPDSWPRLLRCWRQVRSVELQPVDLVHSLEGYPTGLVGHWLANRVNAGHVVTGVGTYSVQWRRRYPDRWAYEAVLRRARAVCAISHGTAARMRQSFPSGLAGKKLRVVLLGCDATERVSRAVADEPRAGRPLLLSVGAVKPRKGHAACIEAFARIRSVIPDAEYVIAGAVDDERYVKCLRARMAALQVEGVTFLGHVPGQQLDELYRTAKLFLMAPQESDHRFEGFGLVFLEAGAYGLPVVATRSGGVPDAVDDESTGILCPPGDSEALANAALRLLRNEDLARRMGAANRRKAELLSWRRFAAEQMAVYRQILDGPAAQS